MPDDARARRVCLEFGARLRERRLELGLTQAQVAEKAGVSLRYLSQIEQGSRNPTLVVLIHLCHALGTKPEALVLGLDRVI